MGQFGSHWKDFHEIFQFIVFRKYLEKFRVSLKSGKTGTLHEDQYTFFSILLSSS